MNRIIVAISLLLLTNPLLGRTNSIVQPPYAQWTRTELVLTNGKVQRIIRLPASAGQFFTTLYKPVEGEFAYFTKTNPDFQFALNGKTYTGLGDWRLLTIQRTTDATQGDGAAVTLQSNDGAVEVTVRYLLYPDLPVIRKSLIVKNRSADRAQLESVDIEKFIVTNYNAPTFSWVCHDYGRRRSIGPYEGNRQDALVTVHNSDWQQGIVIGNEAAGVVKHTSVFWDEPAVLSGFTHKEDRYPFRKYIAPGDSFSTPSVFTIVYNNTKDPDKILNTVVPDFVRRHLGARLYELAHKPTFVYNTWVPFEKDINEKLVMELAKAAAEAGMKEFVIDDGWQTNYGDWIIDAKKFPNGLKPVFDYIKSLGMKPGLWVSVGSASPSSQVYKAHPEWFVLDEHQHPANLHADDLSMRTACFGTDWRSYIQDVLLKLALDYGLEYLKLDFTVVTSTYRFGNRVTGCYATHHPGHVDHRESLYTNYEAVWTLFDALHKAKPSLFIDCTFETMGGLQLIDYAMLKHADGNWLSNFVGPDAKIDLRIRNMAWWRSPAMPATALVIGNPEMQDGGWEMHLKSLAGALPIMLGDPRKLATTDLKKYRAYADWLQAMENKHQIMSYRQDLSGFGEPMEGMWDGFQRMNTDSKRGGIVGVFRHGANEITRNVVVQHIDPARQYQVRSMEGTVLATLSGQALQTTGFPIRLTEPYAGVLLEINAN